MKLAIIIPVYNERKTLKEILKRIEAVDLGKIQKEVIIIDDLSTDGSREVIKKLSKKYIKIFHDKNRGKGAALKSGIKSATGDFIIFQDADLEYDPGDYTRLLLPILDSKADVVIGSRFVGEKFVLFGKDKTMHSSHWVGNKFLTFVFNLLYGTRLTDIEPCYKMFKKDILKTIKVYSDRFEYDIELMCKLVKKRCRLVQIQIKYSPRSFKDGKKISWKDGIVAFITMLKNRF